LLWLSIEVTCGRRLFLIGECLWQRKIDEMHVSFKGRVQLDVRDDLEVLTMTRRPGWKKLVKLTHTYIYSSIYIIFSKIPNAHPESESSCLLGIDLEFHKNNQHWSVLLPYPYRLVYAVLPQPRVQKSALAKAGRQVPRQDLPRRQRWAMVDRGAPQAWLLTLPRVTTTVNGLKAKVALLVGVAPTRGRLICNRSRPRNSSSGPRRRNTPHTPVLPFPSC
jgi:hypothetical protein